MQKGIKIVFGFLFLFVLASGELLAKTTKMYEVESGVVTYEISGGGSMMGIKTSTQGTKILSFLDWGNLHLTEESKKVNTNGEIKQEKSLVKFDNGIVLSVDAEQKIIMKTDMQGLVQGMGEGKSSMTQAGREMMQQMGGKMVAKESILGYACEVWEFQWGKVWGHKGVVLKTQSTMMGITYQEIATKVEFGVNVPSSKFTLPNYPVRSVDAMMMQNFEAAENQEDAKEAEATPQELKELMKNLGGMFGK